MTKQELATLMEKTDYKAWEIILKEDKEIAPFLLKHDVTELRLEFVKMAWFMGLRTEQLKHFVLNYNYTDEQLLEIAEGIDNFGLNKMKVCMNPKLSLNTINAITKAYEAGLSIKRAKLVANPELNYMQCAELIKIFLNNKLPDEFAEYIANPKFSNLEMDQMVKCYINGVSLKKIRIIFESEIEKPVECYLVANHILPSDEYGCYPYTEKELKLLTNPVYDPLRITVIAKAIKAGIPFENVKKLANPCYNAEQMLVISKGYFMNLSDEQMELFMSPVFDAKQMDEIFKSFEDLDIDQVKVFADASISHEAMAKMREAYLSNNALVISNEVDKITSNCIVKKRRIVLKNLM